MGRNNYFRFKQFTVVQENSAMKVGVDSVMLGAWADARQSEKILDVGSGTGLLSLMMAQRTHATITSLEIDSESFQESLVNFKNSLWYDRITAFNLSFQEFSANRQVSFDHIISNPPYFLNSSLPADFRRKQARHAEGLSYSDLIIGVSRMLDQNGKLSVILPIDGSTIFIEMAESNGFYLNRRTLVKHKPEKPFHRSLLEFSSNPALVIESELVIEVNNEYTSEYKNLTSDFYPAF